MTLRAIAAQPALKTFLIAVLAVVMAMTVSACGRKGPLELPSEESQAK